MNLHPHWAKENVFTPDMISPTELRRTIADHAIWMVHFFTPLEHDDQAKFSLTLEIYVAAQFRDINEVIYKEILCFISTSFGRILMWNFHDGNAFHYWPVKHI